MKPIDGALPTFRILVLLFAKIGLPYFMLASTGPLLTAWFNRVYPGRLPFSAVCSVQHWVTPRAIKLPVRF